MNVREARLLAAQCWAAAGKRHDHDCDEYGCDTGNLPPLSPAEVSEYCDELILIDDATVRTMILTAMFLHRHQSAYPAIVGRSLVDQRHGALLDWKNNSFLGWKTVSRAAQTYLAMVVFNKTEIDFGDRIIEVLTRFSRIEEDSELSDEVYAEIHGREGWTTNPDGSAVFRELSPVELAKKRTDETDESRLYGSYELAKIACSEREAADRIAHKQAEVVHFIEQLVRDLFDDEVSFADFHSITQRLLHFDLRRPYFELYRLLLRAVQGYIVGGGFPQGITEYTRNDGMVLGSVTFNDQGRSQWYRRQTPPTWVQHEFARAKPTD